MLQNMFGEEDREDFLRNVNYRVVRERIKTEKVYPVVFQRKFNGKDRLASRLVLRRFRMRQMILCWAFKLVNDIVEHEKERSD